MPVRPPIRPYPHSHYYVSYYGPHYYQIKRSDEDIRADIHRALMFDTWVNAGKIDVDIKNGVVTLTGTVGSIVEKRAAGDDAWDVPGVLDVNNELIVKR